MRLKRIKSICLVVFIIFAQCPIFAADNIPVDVSGTEYENDYIILSGLSIMEKGDDTNFRPYSYITRGEFAKIAAVLMGGGVMKGQNVFSDVEETSSCFDAVSILYNYGIISKDGDGRFEPDVNIKGAEAVKILMNILGYEVIARQKGGYPNGYMLAANETRLTKNISIIADKPVTYGMAAKLIVNALDIPVAEIESIEENNAVLSFDGEKLLYKNLGIEKVSGTVNANSVFSIDGKGTCSGKNEIRIDNDVFRISNISDKNFIGRYVNCYFVYDKQSDTKNVKLLLDNTGKNDMVTIDAEDFNMISGYNVLYRRKTDGKDMSLAMSPDIAVIHNGQVVEEISDSSFKIKMGYITFINNDGRSGYDVAVINSYENILVSDISEDYIYSEFTERNNIDITENAYDSFEIYNEYGDIILLEDVKEGDVISVFKSENGNVLKAVKSGKTLNGTVEAVKSENGKTKLRINGEYYTLSDDFDTVSSIKLKAGLGGDFCFDAYGKIFTIVDGNTDRERFGFVIRTGMESKGIDKTVKIKLLEDDGRIYVRQCADRVTVDGNKYKNEEQVAEAVKTAVEKPVIYRTNSVGEIVFLDTPETSANNEDDILRCMITDANIRYKTSTKVFEGKLAIDSSTCVFVVPQNIDSARDSEFGAANSQYFANDTYYYGVSGYAADDNLIAGCMVLRDSYARNDGHIFVVKDFETVLDDGEEVTKLNVVDGKTESSYITSSKDVFNTLYKIKFANYDSGKPTATEIITDNIVLGKGDVVMLEFDADDKVTAIDVVYSAANETLYSINPNTSDYHANCYRYAYSEAIGTQDGIVKVSVGGSEQYYNIKNCRVWIYDSSLREEMKLSEGTYKDVRDGSQCIFISKGGTPATVIIYK